MVVRFLEANGVRWDAIAQNRGCGGRDLAVKGALVVLEDYLEAHRCNVIVGFGSFSAAMLEPLNKTNIAHLYNYDFLGCLQMGSESLFPGDHLEAHADELSALEQLLADERSVAAMRAFLRQRIDGTYMKEDYEHAPQYFDDAVISFSDGEVFVDCGSYDGQNSIDFIKLMDAGGKRIDHIYAVEPDAKNLEKTRDALDPYPFVSVLNNGIGERESIAYSSDDGTTASFLASDGGGSEVAIMPIDSMIPDAEDKRITFIKMDIEDFELDWLKGAEKTIRGYRPKLAICVYHKYDDLLTIPQYVLSLRPDYKLYMRNYAAWGTELVMYAV